jgi:NitT/TauT family transport system permease protein
MACFIGSFILALGFVIFGRLHKWVTYIMSPFITLFRALPTAVLMVLIAVVLIPVLPLVPIVVAFFIIFPMLYEGMNGAINNVDKKNLEMANVFNVSKHNQIRNIYIPAILPYIFSSFVAAFGLTFKITIASQMVQSFITVHPDYPSIGMIIASNINGNYAVIIA